MSRISHSMQERYERRQSKQQCGIWVGETRRQAMMLDSQEQQLIVPLLDELIALFASQGPLEEEEYQQAKIVINQIVTVLHQLHRRYEASSKGKILEWRDRKKEWYEQIHYGIGATLIFAGFILILLVYAWAKIKKERKESRSLLDVWEFSWVVTYRGHYGPEGVQMDALVGKWQEFTGYSEERFLGPHALSFQQMIDTRDVDKVKEGLALVISSRQPATLTYRLTTAQGRERWVMDYVQALGEDDAGDPLLAGCWVDITPVMVQHTLAERGKDQLHGEIERYQEIAALVSHKIRSQITLLQGRFSLSAGLLMERGGQPFLSQVTSTSRQLEQTAQEMLEAVYHTSEGETPFLSILQPAMLVRQILDEPTESPIESYVTKEYRLEIAWYGWYEGQATLLRSAFRQGLATLVNQQTDGELLVQGRLISMEEQQIWLSLHFRWRETPMGGSSFPDWQLANLQGAMEALAGKMHLDEGDGGISLLFPLQPVGFAHGHQVLNPPNRIPELHLLLVEDDPVLQDMLSEMLEKEGHQVSIAGNGREALEALAAGSYDLALMDVVMPEMNGLQATWQIRHGLTPEMASLPVVALTADLSEVTLRQCIQVGMDGIVAKPVEMERLTQVMAQVLVARDILAPAPSQGKTDGSNELPVVNGAVVGRLRHSMGQEKLMHVARMMVNNGEELVSRLQKAAHEGDRQEAIAAAHRLAGVTGNLGLDRVAYLARRLETELPELTDDQWFARLPLLVGEVGRAVDQLVRVVEDQ
ncbi:MAG: response regulator [Magnetococcales bacterium]|nr:response regulator [Magnetococcales bacterium]